MNQKTNNIIFWITTSFIVISEGIIPALTFRTQLARDGISHLGYPDYFGVMIVGFRILGVFALLLPQISTRIKEWAYAGFTIEFLSASISYTAVDGLTMYCFIPLISLTVLFISYLTFSPKTKICACHSRLVLMAVEDISQITQIFASIGLFNACLRFNFEL